MSSTKRALFTPGSSQSMGGSKKGKKQRIQDAAVSRSLGRLGMKPELKSIDFVYSNPQLNNLVINTLELTNIGQGAAEGQRVGDEIRIKRIEITGQPCGDSGQAKMFIIRVAQGVSEPPQYGFFNGTIGQRYIRSYGWDIHSITRGNQTGVASVVDKHHPDHAVNFNPPMKVKYSLGPAVHNRIWACFINGSGVNATKLECVFRVYYYDT